MDRLWRPWRMAYIRGGAGERNDPDACFLCDAAKADPEQDRRLHVLGRGERVFAILNAFPYNTGHLMVAPQRHVGEIEELTTDESAELWGLVTRSVAAHRRTTRPQGFNIGLNLGAAAGAGVPGHLHVHVVPRWDGDTNFMPVTADAKVLPESLQDSFETLRPAFEVPLGEGD